MKRLFFSLALLGSFAAPAAVYGVRDFGAKGDGVSIDTAAIQRAVDAAVKAGGGEVFFDPGTYVSGTIHLGDDVDFHVGPGATLLATTNRNDYNRWDFCPQNSRSLDENASGGHLVVAVGRKNVTLRGPGKIDGNARFFCRDRDGRGYEQMKDIPWRPSQMVYLTECENVRITDIELADSPYWSCFLHGCRHVFARGLNVHTMRKPHSHNGDGLDIDSCQNVTVSDSFFSTSDDCITLRNNARKLPHPQDCGFVTIANCNLSTPKCAIRIGVGKGLVHDVTATGIVVHDSRTAISLTSSWWKGGSVAMENLRFTNFAVDCRRFFRAIPLQAGGVALRNITVDGLSGRTKEPAILIAKPDFPIENVTFRNVCVPTGVEAVGVKDLRIEGGTLKRLEPDEKRQEELRKIAADPWACYQT